jgi:type IV pilus assembly protein PilC
MVAAGEAGGILDTILMRLATFMEKNDALVRKVKGAMIYPASSWGWPVRRSPCCWIFVIPCSRACSPPWASPLPLPTRIVIALSEFLQGYWWALIIAGFVGVPRFKKYYATANGQLAIDRLLLHAPVLGDVLRKSAVSRFTRTLGHAHQLGRQHPRRPRDHGQDGGQPRRLRTRSSRRAPRSPVVTRSPPRSQKSASSRPW